MSSFNTKLEIGIALAFDQMYRGRVCFDTGDTQQSPAHVHSSFIKTLCKLKQNPFLLFDSKRAYKELRQAGEVKDVIAEVSGTKK